MKGNSFVRCVALLAMVALAVPAFAKPVTKTIQLSQNAKIGKSELKAGEYRLLIDGTKVSVQRGKDQVAEAEARWEEREAKSPYSAVVMNSDGRVQEVRFAGEKRVLVLSD